MNIEEDLNSQIEVAGWIDRNLSFAYLLQSDSEKWSHACFDMVIEHHVSIIFLCKEQLYSSAFALMRAGFEALIRGLWLRHVATKNEIEALTNDKVAPQLDDLLKAVEASEGVNEGLLSCIKEIKLNIFNHFTYTGTEAASAHIDVTITGHDSFQENDIIKSLRFSGLIAVLTAVELASLSKKQELIHSTFEFAKKYGK